MPKVKVIKFHLHYKKQCYLIIHFACFIKIEEQLIFEPKLSLTGGKSQSFQVSLAPLKLGTI